MSETQCEHCDKVDSMRDRLIKMETRQDGHGDRINLLEQLQSSSKAQIDNLQKAQDAMFSKLDKMQTQIQDMSIDTQKSIQEIKVDTQKSIEDSNKDNAARSDRTQRWIIGIAVSSVGTLLLLILTHLLSKI